MDEKTKALLQKAKQGDKDAQRALGRYYSIGIRLGFDFDEVDGVDPDIYWYRRAAENGHAEASYLLGRHYCIGLGVEKDSKQADYWYRKAAEQGNAKAQGIVKKL